MLPCQHLFASRHNITVCTDTEHGICLGKLFCHFFGIALGKAAGDDNVREQSLIFERNHIQNIFDCLFFGIFNKAAGIDNHNVCPFGTVCNFKAGIP